MQAATRCLDMAKKVFQVHGADTTREGSIPTQAEVTSRGATRIR